MCGLPGVGKSTVAQLLAKTEGAVVLRSDKIRKERLEELGHPLNVSGIYPEKAMQKVYDIMFAKAEKVLQEGKSVILDATFAKKVNRDRARELARSMGIPLRLVYVTCDTGSEMENDRIIQARMSKRGKTDESAAQFFHYLTYASTHFEYPSDGEIDIKVDNTKEIPRLANKEA